MAERNRSNVGSDWRTLAENVSAPKNGWEEWNDAVKLVTGSIRRRKGKPIPTYELVDRVAEYKNGIDTGLAMDVVLDMIKRGHVEYNEKTYELGALIPQEPEPKP